MYQTSFKTLTARAASQLDQELMSTGAFSIDQLMELAGLSVAKAIHQQYSSKLKAPSRVLFLVGPGNNGGDGLVAARHLKIWGKFDPILFYPKKSTKSELYKNLLKQLQDLGISEVSGIDELKSLLLPESAESDIKLIIDALFGFSFKPPIRTPFDDVISFLSEHFKELAPIVSIDIPSGWDVDEGPTSQDINSSMLISLTAPKPCARFFTSPSKVHYLGGRFINPKIAIKYDIEDLTKLYKEDDLIVKL